MNWIYRRLSEKIFGTHVCSRIKTKKTCIYSNFSQTVRVLRLSVLHFDHEQKHTYLFLLIIDDSVCAGDELVRISHASGSL